MPLSSLFAILIALALGISAQAGKPFVIKVVDEATGRGVPLVKLSTVHKVNYITDNAGVVAFDEPGLMHGPIFFTVSSHGYEFPKNGLGFRGKRLMAIPGKSATITIKRINIAERLCRLTGAGLYHHSVRVGLPVPIKQPLLNAKVLGSDSVHTAIFANKLYWLWGDTNRPRYPLGISMSPWPPPPRPRKAVPALMRA